MAKWLRYVVLIVAVGASATVLSTTSAGQAFAQGAIKPIQALIVNDAAHPVPVVGTDLYPAPFQGNLNFDANPSVKTCVSVPAGKGLILELVSVRTFSDDATAQFDLVIVTIAGGVEAHHDITLERLPLLGTQVYLSKTQPLRAYADPGNETLCFRAGAFSGGPYLNVPVSFSGQLVNVP